MLKKVDVEKIGRVKFLITRTYAASILTLECNNFCF